MFASQEPSVVKEKAEQVQITRSDLAAEEKVASQAAVDVFNDGAGTDYIGDDFPNDFVSGVEFFSKSFTQKLLVAGVCSRHPLDCAKIKKLPYIG